MVGEQGISWLPTSFSVHRQKSLMVFEGRRLLFYGVGEQGRRGRWGEGRDGSLCHHNLASGQRGTYDKVLEEAVARLQGALPFLEAFLLGLGQMCVNGAACSLQ